MDYTWLVWAVIAGLAVMAMLERKAHWVARAVAALIAVGFAYNAVIALFSPDAWLSWIAIALAVWATFWVRRSRGRDLSERSSGNDEDDDE